MKKSILVFVIAALVIASTLLWIYSATGFTGLSGVDLVQFGVIFLIVAFAILVGITRLSSARRGQPAEDEMSKKIMNRTAALSFYISLYFWVFLLFVKDRVKMDSEQLLGSGILAMALIFAFTWLVLYFRGLRNE